MKRRLSTEMGGKILHRKKKVGVYCLSLTNHKTTPALRTNPPRTALYSQTAQPPQEFNKSLKERLRPGQHLHHIGVVITRAGGVLFDYV